MTEQRISLKQIDSFKSADIFECGQCFRWNQQIDGSYIGVVGRNVLKVKQEKESIAFEGVGEEDISTIITSYFDLERDYGLLKEKLAKTDSHLEESTQYGEGIRILRQDLWETIVSFILSANNNIPRIKGMIERLAKAYGDPIYWRENTYYTFPTPKQLAKVSIQDYRDLGFGFRDKYVYHTVQKVLAGEISLIQLEDMSTKKAKENLLTLAGVGPKVADCILLFSTLNRLEVFPVDVWIERVMNELYIHTSEGTVSKKEVLRVAEEKFGTLAGLAQQYLFYWRREREKTGEYAVLS